MQYNEVLMGYLNETTQESVGPMRLMLKGGRGERREGERKRETSCFTIIREIFEVNLIYIW